MIRMPRRSVTRFFIPLIDVLILLFCIFLLMEFETGAKADAESEKAEEIAFENTKLEGELARRLNELHKFEELRPQLTELEQLRQEVERLRNANQQELRNRIYVRTIEYDGKDGSISFYDESRPDQPVVKIPDDKAALALIERHNKEAAATGRTVYYQFVLPRPYRFVYPTGQQKAQYARWFAGAANSLEVKAK
jgi:hypothetical protein